MVIDEFGGTAGIISLEDVLEQIFGEIEDEHDEQDLIEKQVDENEYVLSCRLEVKYLNERYGLGIEESREYDTLAGYIISQSATGFLLPVSRFRSTASQIRVSAHDPFAHRAGAGQTVVSFFWPISGLITNNLLSLEARKKDVFDKPDAEPHPFGLCRGEKTSAGKQTNEKINTVLWQV